MPRFRNTATVVRSAAPGSQGAPAEPGAITIPIGIRPLAHSDLAAVVRIDAFHTGSSKRGHWKRIFANFLGAPHDRFRVGLAADGPRGLLGYLLGEVRAFEFGSEPCGWVFAVGVDAAALHRGVGSALLDEACRGFRQAGVLTVRTMVKRNDVPVLAFFRRSGFTGGPYVQLEIDLTGA